MIIIIKDSGSVLCAPAQYTRTVVQKTQQCTLANLLLETLMKGSSGYSLSVPVHQDTTRTGTSMVKCMRAHVFTNRRR